MRLSYPFRIVVPIAVVLMVILPVAPTLAREADTAATADPATAPAEEEAREDEEDPPKTEMTRGELQRQLDEARAKLEDLLVKLERQDRPTEKQIEEFKALRSVVADLEAQIEATEVPTPATSDESWRARWVRFEKALEDVTRYDLKDGMFRFRLGVNLQIDATLARGSPTLTDRIHFRAPARVCSMGSAPDRSQ